MTQKLGEICDEVNGVIRTGPFGSQLHESDYVDEGVPVVMPKDIIDGRVSVASIARVDHETVSRLAQHKLRPGDIVYGRRGDIGRQALVTEREAGWLCGTGCLRLSLGDAVLDPLFLHYYLRQASVIQWIANQAIGATMPNLNTSILKSVPVSFPPLRDQHKIARTLSAYDDLIENNTRRIRVLEAMAQEIYREWFVHFRFPGHEKVKMVDSQLGLIPDRWEVKKIGDALEMAYGKALKAENRSNGSVPVYGSGGIVGYHNECLVNGPGIIVGRKGNVGSVYWSHRNFFPIDTVFFVRTQVCLQYVYFNLRAQNFVNNDAAVPGLSRAQAYSLPFLLPDTRSLTAFRTIVCPMFDEIYNLQEKTSNLRRTRDLLLPRLLSGAVAPKDDARR